METTTPCQPSNTDTNQYLSITIRVLATVGFSYLLSAFYQLLKWPLLSRHSPLERADGKRFLPSSSDTFDGVTVKLTTHTLR